MIENLSLIVLGIFIGLLVAFFWDEIDSFGYDIYLFFIAKFGLLQYNLEQRQKGRRRGFFQKLPRFGLEEMRYMVAQPGYKDLIREYQESSAWKYDGYTEEEKFKV